MVESTTRSIIYFDRFTVDPLKRTLSRDGKLLGLNPKTFDVLLALLAKPGEVVSKDALLESVWEGQFVEENNLTVNISLLRKALGERKGSKRFIVTVPGNGYRFVADVRVAEILAANGDIVDNFSQGGSTPDEPKRVINPEVLERSDNKHKISRYLIEVIAILILGLGAFWFFKEVIPTSQSGNRNYVTRSYPTEGMPMRAVISISGRLLAYIGREKGLESVWVGNVATGNNRRITQPGSFEVLHINFSPDEEYVYFVSRKSDAYEWILNRVSVFGGAVQDLVKNVHSSISFSPDGSRLAFIRRGDVPRIASLVIVDTDNTENEQVLASVRGKQDFSVNAVSWSPSGSHIVVLVSTEAGEDFALTAINVFDGQWNVIGDRFWSRNTGVVWDENGEGLILIEPSFYGHDGSSEIWRVSHPEGIEQKITSDVNNYHPPTLSVTKDGKIATLLYRIDPQIYISSTMIDPTDDQLIVSGSKNRSLGTFGLAITRDNKVIFTSKSGHSQGLWEMDADGSNQIQLTPSQDDSYDQHPEITGDNKFIVFESDRSAEKEIWRADRDGRNLKQLTSSGGNGAPTITPDGLWVIYAHYDHDLATLWRVSIDGGKSELFSEDLASFPTVSPDGKYVAASYGSIRGTDLPRVAIYPLTGGNPIKVFPVPDGILYNRLRWTPDGRSIACKDSKQGLWLIDITSGERKKLELKDDFRVSHFAWSVDGERFVYSGGVQVHEIIILEQSLP